MDHGTEPRDKHSPRLPVVGVGARVTLWIVAVFVVTLVVFVGLDIYHEARFADSLGATRAERADLLASTVVLHAFHAAVTVLAFGLAIHLVVHRLVSRRIAKIVLAVHSFRRGTWRVQIPSAMKDEIEWLTEAFRQLGPDLERKLTTFVEVDRKAVVAQMGSRYEQSVAPPTREIIAVARARMRSGRDVRVWREIEENAERVLAELGRLGRPDHPTTADIVHLEQSEQVVTRRSGRSIESRGPHRL